MSRPMGKRTSRQAPVDAEARLNAVAEAFERGALDEALAGADALLAEQDTLTDALHWRASALAELGRLDEALETYARALKLAPDDLELMFSAAECLVGRAGDDREAVEDGLALCARGRKLAQRAGDDALVFEFLVLEGIGFNQVGECARALTSLDAALELVPEAVEARLERAVRARPQVVVDAADVDTGKDKVRDLPELSEARWVDVPSMALLQPGPSLARGLEELFELLHPRPALPKP